MNLSRIAHSGSFRWGVDEKGKGWVFDVTRRKMIWYGDKMGAGNLASILGHQYGANVQYEAPREKPKTLMSKVSSTPAIQAFTARSSYGVGGGGGGYSRPAKKLDTAQIDSLNSILNSYDITRDRAKQKAAIKHDTSLREKEEELRKETEKYNTKKLSNLQEFADAKNDTDINTRNTLENLISSLSTMGLGGSRALSRQVLDAANKANRKANATQAQNAQGLDTAYNQYKAGHENDVKKINDQYRYDIGEADKAWGQSRQNALYKMADVYNAADKSGDRDRLMRMGNDLSGFIANSNFINPEYNGAMRQMATPELAKYNQDIATYDTLNIGQNGQGEQNGATAETSGNLGIRAAAINDKDLGVKKRLEGRLAYGV